MSKVFDLKILASDHIFYDGKCTNLVIPVEDGEIGIMANHEDIAISMSPGSLHLVQEDGTVIQAVTGTGIASVNHNTVIILVDFAEKPEEIDEKRAQAAKERAEERLRQKQSIREYHTSQASLARAMARLSGRKHME
ncbi:MAG: ATP synthase F1 subunit epsilon [Lachnospiraceae bacterium]|nr:ATP synthase F1 subunit epsilon [Lachnospiraceae bacterium]